MSDLQIVPGRFKIAMIDQESGRIVLTVIYDRPSMDVVVYGEEKAVYISMYKEAGNVPTHQDFYIVLKEMTRSAMTLAFDIFHEKDIDFVVLWDMAGEEDFEQPDKYTCETKIKLDHLEDYITDEVAALDDVLETMIDVWSREYIMNQLKKVKCIGDCMKIIDTVKFETGKKVFVSSDDNLYRIDSDRKSHTLKILEEDPEQKNEDGILKMELDEDEKIKTSITKKYKFNVKVKSSNLDVKNLYIHTT